jgi:hypothetical protein
LLRVKLKANLVHGFNFFVHKYEVEVQLLVT